MTNQDPVTDGCVWCKHPLDDGEGYTIPETDESLCEACLDDMRRYKRDVDIALFASDRYDRETVLAIHDAHDTAMRELDMLDYTDLGSYRSNATTDGRHELPNDDA